MKEKFIGKFHVIFYRNYEKHLLPSVVYTPKTISCCRALSFAWLKWRITLFSNYEDKQIGNYNGRMAKVVKTALTDVSEEKFAEQQTSLTEVIEWVNSFFHPAY